MEASAESVRAMVAANLRRARTRRGLSLSELSRRSSIGKATLSELETGAGNPTIETVFSLSRALEVPISDLFDQRDGAGITVVRGAEQDVLRGEAVDLRMLRRIQAGNAIVEVYDQQIRPTGSQRSQGHVGIEHTIVQAGRLLVEVGDGAAELGPGDCVAFDATSPHAYTAIEAPVRSVLLLQYGSGPELTAVATHT